MVGLGCRIHRLHLCRRVSNECSGYNTKQSDGEVPIMVELSYFNVSSYPLSHLSLSRYIYIYIYANFIKHNRHFMPTYFLLDPFEFPYYFYCIRGELICVLSIVVCIPSTFCPTWGHHKGRIYYKSDVTFLLANYYCVRTSLLLKIMAFAFKCNSVNSASS